jgi:hypothetical protein
MVKQHFFCRHFEVKFEAKNEEIFMFKAKKNSSFYNETPRKESIRYGIFPKTFLLNHLKSLKGSSSSSLNKIDILIIILFRMLLFFPFFPKIHHHD